ncbi:bcl-2 homologous antagonist/killer isoform X2 [Anomalospiza imberbis]|uniref:bcl-2 homologous antagonist/killer isoform X2 n=1 Tax=Anomalospiza imberbis TaxID=187417 RepID=UPI00358EA423
MASGNEGDPPRAQGSQRRRLSSEGRVAEEAEEVFRSYAFYRYQQEREERGAELPPDPEIEQIQQDLRRRYDAEFRTMLESLQPTRENAYEHFTKIASSLFESGINWGRVIALLAFGYRMAMHVWQHGVSGFLRRIARYVGDFMLQNRIARWIAQQGGWEAVQNLDNVYMKYMLVAAVAVLGYLVLRRFFTPCTP